MVVASILPHWLKNFLTLMASIIVFLTLTLLFIQTSLPLLATSGLPHIYWIDVEMTATFLVNGLPTSILDYETPYGTLFHHVPNYTQMKVFRCAFFIPFFALKLTISLSFVVRNAFFLGYSVNHPSDRYRDPSTDHLILSRHVIFDEHAKDPSFSTFPSAWSFLHVPLRCSFHLFCFIFLMCHLFGSKILLLRLFHLVPVSFTCF